MNVYPDRASAVREVADSGFDFTEVINFRNGMSHLAEWIEHRWHLMMRHRLSYWCEQLGRSTMAVSGF